MEQNQSLTPGPLLSSIHNPADLRTMTSAELVSLAQEIRQYLVQSVSRTGGHLGPNLGVVELTIALHRVFSSPRDTLIFDTGHQAYVHKLLTGRQDFSHLRQMGGLSGYPSRAESVHDVVENSHASTALSWAAGVASTYAAQSRDDYVVAVIGDGALTGGMAWEALNNIAAHDDQPLIIVVNDNGRSYAPTIGGLAHHLDALRTSRSYEKALEWGKRKLLAHGKPGEAAFDALHGIKAGVKDVLAPQVMFEDLGLKYLGPIDGHDEVAVEFALTRAKAAKRPVIVHVITQKGRGYTPAEEDVADRFHAVGVIHPETGLPVAPSRFGWTAVFAEEIVALARTNPKLVGISAAMLAPVGLLPLSQQFPDRVIDVGIAEQHAVTTAAGMAFAGAHPVVALYATFLNRAFDQVLMDVALHRAGVTFVLDRSGITGDDGASHNGMWDIAMLSLVPGLRLAAPRDENSLRQALREAVEVNDAPTVIRYPKGSLPDPITAIATHPWGDDLYASPELPQEAGGVGEDGEASPTGTVGEAAAPSGEERRAKIAILATGAFAELGIDVGRVLASEGYRVRVIDPRWLLPVSSELIAEVKDADLIVSLEDGLADCGFASQVRASLAADNCFTPVLGLGIGKQFLAHASRAQILRECGLEVPAVVARVHGALRHL